jgi:hypothetical protein
MAWQQPLQPLSYKMFNIYSRETIERNISLVYLDCLLMFSNDKVYSAYNCPRTWSMIESNTFTFKLDLVSRQEVTSLMTLALSTEETSINFDCYLSLDFFR